MFVVFLRNLVVLLTWLNLLNISVSNAIFPVVNVIDETGLCLLMFLIGVDIDWLAIMLFDELAWFKERNLEG